MVFDTTQAIGLIPQVKLHEILFHVDQWLAAFGQIVFLAPPQVIHDPDSRARFDKPRDQIRADLTGPSSNENMQTLPIHPLALPVAEYLAMVPPRGPGRPREGRR